MKLEETENLRLQYVNDITKTISHLNDIQAKTQNRFSQKIYSYSKNYERNQKFKCKRSIRKWCNYCRRYGHSIAECRQKHQGKSNRPLKQKEPNKSF